LIEGSHTTKNTASSFIVIMCQLLPMERTKFVSRISAARVEEMKQNICQFSNQSAVGNEALSPTRWQYQSQV
jgi:hypothetical protein